jgi:hypothetical protein
MSPHALLQRIALGASWATLFTASIAHADEGGISFWLPGQMGSLAAVPGAPGFSLPLVYYHTSADSGGDVLFSRGGRLTLGVDATGDLLFGLPTYTFATPIAGGQVAVSMGAAVGHLKVAIAGTLAGSRANVISGAETDSLDGVADLYPLATWKWNLGGVHNVMTYAMAGIPVGSYRAGRLANLGTNHWSIDLGGGYTYLDPKAGIEFSSVLGMTHNFKNNDTGYRNGLDVHLDWAASRFLGPTMHAGLVGYLYGQLESDHGTPAVLGSVKSRVAGIGPQIGWFVHSGERKYYMNLRGNYEFGAKSRAEGWNLTATLLIPF